MTPQYDPTTLPPDLPVPADDRACDHLAGMSVPAIALPSTSGRKVVLATLPDRTIVYCYPRSGRPVFTPATVAALLVFFVFALQCMSTLAVMRRETNSWRWPAFAFGYLLALAWCASFVTHRAVAAWTGA